MTAILFSQHQALLGFPERRTNAIAQLIGLAKERNAVGINIDFEAVPSELRDSVSAFVRELRLTAGPEFAIVLDLPPVDWSDAFDVIELQRILDLYYEKGLKMREIGVIFGFSESRVCQIHAEIIKKLRAALK